MAHDSQADPATDPSEPLARLWRDHRRRLLDIGYRMLGTVTEAEDVAAEAYTRLLDADHNRIDDPVGWLVAVTGRLCIDRLRSADRSRRAYVGPWLPEPLVNIEDPAAADPADRITLDESVRMALLVVLEHLSPAERTVLVLHDMFALPFDEVAVIVGRSPAACRQLASRARRRVQTHPEQPRTDVSRADLEDIAQRFADACGTGTIEPLLQVLASDVVGDFDSGGVVPGAPLHPLRGAEAVAGQLVATFAHPGFSFQLHDVNGDPGVVVFQNGQPIAVICLVPGDGLITLLHGIGNPAKLARLTGPPSI